MFKRALQTIVQKYVYTLVTLQRRIRVKGVGHHRELLDFHC